ncbi:hypothetical protein [Levilactobacillus zymae]|uniref:hypothetical protein n=1 Tax=Levilactobacillus zymae TaxID=267363 RepID=UPI0028B3E5E5|nr:hypothetical protein [Levilactobacillus zymae]MDT6980276.1 hypothetical protein [Levilactobacillus zymae]
MSRYEDHFPGRQPLTEQQRQLLERFFMVNAIQRRVIQQLEDVLGPLAPYQQQRLFFQDVTGLTHFRRNFFGTVGQFLGERVNLTYQLAVVEHGSHRKRTYTVEHLDQVHRQPVAQGTVLETLNYRQLGCKIQRIYTVQAHHLYWEKNQIWVHGQEMAWVDGLMHLQQQLSPHAVWLQQGFLAIHDYT